MRTGWESRETCLFYQQTPVRTYPYLRVPPPPTISHPLLVRLSIIPLCLSYGASTRSGFDHVCYPYDLAYTAKSGQPFISHPTWKAAANQSDLTPRKNIELHRAGGGCARRARHERSGGWEKNRSKLKQWSRQIIRFPRILLTKIRPAMDGSIDVDWHGSTLVNCWYSRFHGWTKLLFLFVSSCGNLDS